MLQVNHYQQQPWRVAVRAKSKNFYFSLKVSKFLPLSKIFRVSVRFKLHPFHFKIKSEPHSSFSWKPKSLKRKLVQIFRTKHTKRDGIVGKWCASKVSLYQSIKVSFFFFSKKFWLIEYITFAELCLCECRIGWNSSPTFVQINMGSQWFLILVAVLSGSWIEELVVWRKEKFWLLVDIHGFSNGSSAAAE